MIRTTIRGVMFECDTAAEALSLASVKPVGAVATADRPKRKYKTPTRKNGNKSETIRQFKVDNPTATPKEIAERLTTIGTKVSAQFVSTVLSTAKKRKVKAK